MRVAANRFASSLENRRIEVKQKRLLIVLISGSARVARVGDRIPRSRAFPKTVLAGHQNQHARSEADWPLRYRGYRNDAWSRISIALLLIGVAAICHGQDASPTPAPESVPIVITATRTDIPLDQSPASAS